MVLVPRVFTFDLLCAYQPLVPPQHLRPASPDISPQPPPVPHQCPTRFLPGPAGIHVVSH